MSSYSDEDQPTAYLKGYADAREEISDQAREVDAFRDKVVAVCWCVVFFTLPVALVAALAALLFRAILGW